MRLAMEDINSRVEDIGVKTAKVEQAQRSGIQAVAMELRDEMAKGDKGKMIAAQKVAIEDMEIRFRTELDGYRAKVDQMMRGQVQVLEEQMAEKMVQVHGESQSRQLALQDALESTRLELETYRAQVHARQEEQRSSFQASLEELDSQLRADMSRIRASAASGGGGGGLDGPVEISLEDADGRAWTFSTASDFLEEVARRLKDHHAQLTAEISARIQHETRIEAEIRTLEARESRIEMRESRLEQQPHETILVQQAPQPHYVEPTRILVQEPPHLLQSVKAVQAPHLMQSAQRRPSIGRSVSLSNSQ